MQDSVHIWLIKSIYEGILGRVKIRCQRILFCVRENHLRSERFRCWVHPWLLSRIVGRVSVLAQIKLKIKLLPIVLAYQLFTNGSSHIALVLKVDHWRHFGTQSRLASFQDLLKFRLGWDELSTRVARWFQFLVPIDTTGLHVVIAGETGWLPISQKLLFEVLTIFDTLRKFLWPLLHIIIIKRRRCPTDTSLLAPQKVISAQSVNQRQIASLLLIFLGQRNQRAHHSCLIKLRGRWLVIWHAH